MFQKISMIVISVLFLAASAVGPVSAGPLRDNFLKAQELRTSAMASYRAGEMDAALAGMKAILALRPGHPTYLLNVAALSANTGDRAGALAALQAYADTGMWADAAGSEDFALFRDDPAFQEIIAKLASNAAPLVASDVAFTLDMQTGLTEGIAYDAKRDRFILSSISEGALYSVERNGRTEKVFAPGVGIPGGFMGLRAVPDEDGLWVTYSAIQQVKGITSGHIGASGYFFMSLETGAISQLDIWSTGRNDEPHRFGDLLLGDDGEVYVTDSQSPMIVSLQRTGRRLRANDFVSLQGIAETPEGRALIVADYALGLLRVELAGDKVVRLPAPPNTNLRGIDGLYRYGDGLIAIPNGARPLRILYIRMNSDWSEVVDVEVLEKAVPGWEEPTLGVIVGEEFYYIANSGWTISASGPPSSEDLEKRGNVVVRRMDLSKLN